MTRLRLLIIDDSEDDRLLYRRCLNRGAEVPYEILDAGNGDDGLKSLEGLTPACVLLDYSLPGLNGVEVLKRIRARHPFLPVIMLTGQGNESVAVAAMQEGAQNYISKSSITPEAIQRIVRVAIEHCGLEKRIDEQRGSLEIFTRALAHDLKEPVRTIRSFSDLLVRKVESDAKTQHYINHIRNAAIRMDALIDTVYLYTRLEGDPLTDREPCDMQTLLTEVKENIADLIRRSQAVITHDTLPTAHVNRTQAQQVMQNLICNAIRHCSASPVIHVSAGESGGQWQFSVRDNGVGISEGDRERIFQPFKRLSHQEEQGLGLGLAICRKIVEAHGGRIGCEPGEGGGTVFRFTFPKAAAAQEPAVLHAIAQTSSVQADPDLASILLVDDSPADIELARILLLEGSGLQCNLSVARDGLEALERMQNTPVDLLLLDINMPVMDGFTLLEKMRAEDRLKNLPVIMCTTSSYDKDMKRARSLGALGYLTKPPEFERLKPFFEKAAGLQLCQKEGANLLLRAA